MTREEAIRIFRKEIECLSHAKCEDCILEKVCDPAKTTPLDSEYIEAYGMAIQALSQEPICPSAGVDCEDCPAYEPCDDTVSRGVFEQVMRERDIAIEQLHELGYELGQMIEPCEVEATKLQQAYNKGFDDCRQAVLEKAINVPIAQIVTEDEVICRKIVFVDDIENMPPVTPQQKYGKWIKHPEIETSTPEYLMFYECSECGDKQCFCKSDIHKKRFCSNCGCRMVEPQESEDKE